MKSKDKEPDEPKVEFNSMIIFLLVAGIACILGGIYLTNNGGMSTGYQTYKTGRGSVQGLSGPGVIFFGVLFTILGIMMSRPTKK